MNHDYNDDDLLAIEEGFEMPPRIEQIAYYVTAKERVYATLIAMEVGQSFVANSSDCLHARKIAERLKMTLAWRKIEPRKVKYENGETGEYPQYRVWLAELPPGGNGKFPSWEQVKLIFRKKPKQA